MSNVAFNNPLTQDGLRQAGAGVMLCLQQQVIETVRHDAAERLPQSLRTVTHRDAMGDAADGIAFHFGKRQYGGTARSGDGQAYGGRSEGRKVCRRQLPTGPRVTGTFEANHKYVGERPGEGTGQRPDKKGRDNAGGRQERAGFLLHQA